MSTPKHKPTGRMSLMELRAEHASLTDGVVKPCRCHGCLNRADAVADELAAREAEPVVVGEDLSQYDPVLLAAGIRAPKAKRRGPTLTPAARAESNKRFARLKDFSRTTEGIAREQNMMARANNWARVVRG